MEATVCCRSVRLVCKEEPLLYPIYKAVKIGTMLGECKVSYCNPSPCIIVPPTNITVEKYVEYRVKELEHNIMVKIAFESGNEEVYIYPKNTWDEVRRRFLTPLSKGLPPREQGALLYGPPGTGKTSMTQIISFILGLNVISFLPSSILSKYLGESEKRLSKLIKRAEDSEPSVLILDDAEWIASSRKLSASAPEESRAYLAMLNLLFRALQKWYREGRRTIALVTTNVSADAIDPAFRRSGRLGRPIFVPLPDFEAVYTLLKELGVPEERCEDLAIKIVNSGLPMSDAVAIARDVLAGEEPRIEPKEERGYTRFIPPTLSSNCIAWLKHVWSDYCLGLRGGSRLWFPLSSTLALPLAAVATGVVCKKPVIVINDPRNIDDAIATARMSDAVLIVDVEVIDTNIVKFIVSKAGRIPVIFVGRSSPNVTCFPIHVNYVTNRARLSIIEILSKLFDIKVESRELEDIKHLSDKQWELVITMLGVFRSKPSILRKKIAG